MATPTPVELGGGGWGWGLGVGRRGWSGVGRGEKRQAYDKEGFNSEIMMFQKFLIFEDA